MYNGKASTTMMEKVMFRQLHEQLHFALEYQFQCVNTLPEEFSKLEALF